MKLTTRHLFKLSLPVLVIIGMSPMSIQANDTLGAIQSGANSLVNKTKSVATDFAEGTREVASETLDSTAEVGEALGEKGATVWQKMKEVGSATAEGVRDGAENVRVYLDENTCDQADALNCKKE